MDLCDTIRRKRHQSINTSVLLHGIIHNIWWIREQKTSIHQQLRPINTCRCFCVWVLFCSAYSYRCPTTTGKLRSKCDEPPNRKLRSTCDEPPSQTKAIREGQLKTCIRKVCSFTVGLPSYDVSQHQANSHRKITFISAFLKKRTPCL